MLLRLLERWAGGELYVLGPGHYAAIGEDAALRVASRPARMRAPGVTYLEYANRPLLLFRKDRWYYMCEARRLGTAAPEDIT